MTETNSSQKFSIQKKKKSQAEKDIVIPIPNSEWFLQFVNFSSPSVVKENGCSDVQHTLTQMCGTLPYSCAAYFHTDVQHSSIELCSTFPDRCAAHFHTDVQHTSDTSAKSFIGQVAIVFALHHCPSWRANECHYKKTVPHSLQKS